MSGATTYTAFAGARRLASGPLSEVSSAIKTALANGAEGLVVFADASGRTVDIDSRNISPDARPTVETDQIVAPKATRGRPKLGVIAREVTLLPRHWDWLGTQRGGASAALRRLVDQARRDNLIGDRKREVQEAVHRVLTTLAGDLPGYEEALRALYAGDGESFSSRLEAWPHDIRLYVQALADRAEAADDQAN